MNRLAETIRQRVTMLDVTKEYGIAVSRAGYACCPFHSEKTGSLRIYPGDRGWYCWGCHAHGDVIDFVARYFNLDFKGALARLDSDFHLGLPLDYEPTPQERLAAAQVAAQERAERQMRENAQAEAEAAYWGDFTALQMCDALLQENRPVNQTVPWNDRFAYALLNRADLMENFKHSQTVMQLTRERGRADGRTRLATGLS
jgi:hypothetical protein